MVEVSISEAIALVVTCVKLRLLAIQTNRSPAGWLQLSDRENCQAVAVES